MLPNTTGSSQKANKRFTSVNPRLEKQLGAYAAAVGASAVAVLAAAPLASAEIVYTPVNVTINFGSSYAIDLNGDGTADFTLVRCQCAGSHTSFLLLQLDAKGNAVRPPVKSRANAGALPVGAIIGNAQSFATATSYGGALMAFGFAYGDYSDQGGPWVNATRRYLGLRFMVEGEVHYGWARLNVGSFKLDDREVTLTGYAYETISDRLIRAGQTSGTDVETATSPTEATAEPSTLGLLALGADGLSASRN